MALTKHGFYLSVIFIALVIFSGIGYVGTSFLNNDRLDLTEGSIDYIAEVKGVNTQSGYEGIANTHSAESELIDPLDSEDNSSVSDTNDFLSTLYIKKERASRPTNFLKLVYNIPTSIIRGVGLDIADWNHYINILTYLILIAIGILIWTRWVNP